MVKYKIVFSKQAIKDKKLLKESGLDKKAQSLIDIIKENPYQIPCEKLGGLDNLFSRRINITHRLVYQVYKDEMKIKIISMWTHYETLRG